MHFLIAEGVKKHNTAEHISGSGLNLSHLHKIFQRDGEDGLRATFVQKNSEGQARVYSTKWVLDSKLTLRGIADGIFATIYELYAVL